MGESTAAAALMEHKKQRPTAAPVPQQSAPNATAAETHQAQVGSDYKDVGWKRETERRTARSRMRPRLRTSTGAGTRIATPGQGHFNHPACGVNVAADADEGEILEGEELEAAAMTVAAASSSICKMRLLEGDRVYDDYAVLRQKH